MLSNVVKRQIRIGQPVVELWTEKNGLVISAMYCHMQEGLNIKG